MCCLSSASPFRMMGLFCMLGARRTVLLRHHSNKKVQFSLPEFQRSRGHPSSEGWVSLRIINKKLVCDTLFPHPLPPILIYVGLEDPYGLPGFIFYIQWKGNVDNYTLSINRGVAIHTLCSRDACGSAELLAKLFNFCFTHTMEDTSRYHPRHPFKDGIDQCK